MGGGGSKSVEFLDEDVSLARRRKTVTDVGLLTALLGDDDDLRSFCRACDNHAVLRFAPTVALAVVIEGEVTATVIGQGGRALRARSFTKAQPIPFFLHGPEPFTIDANDALLFHFGSDLHLQFTATTPSTRCLQMDRRTLSSFLNERPHLSGAAALFATQLTPLLATSAELPIIDRSWGQLLSVLVDIVPFFEGDLVESWADPADAPNSVTSMVLLGRCRSMDPTVNIDVLLDLLDEQHIRMGTYVRRKGSTSSATAAPAGSPSRKKSICQIDWDSADGTSLAPGSVFGVQNAFFSPRKGLHSVFAASNCIVAVFPPVVLHTVTALNAGLLKMWRDAWVVSFLQELKVKLGKPILRTVSELNLQLLASRCSIECRPAGSVVLRQGDQPDQFIIIVDGQLEERYSGDKDHRRRLISGDQYGSSSIVVNVPYKGTVTALEQTTILVVTKATFLQVFAQDRRCIAEIKLRAGGGDIELSAVLRSPDGYRDFLAYVTKEFAAENVLFWKAVEVYQDKFRASLVGEGMGRDLLAVTRKGFGGVGGSGSASAGNSGSFTVSLSFKRRKPFSGMGSSASGLTTGGSGGSSFGGKTSSGDSGSGPSGGSGGVSFPSAGESGSSSDFSSSSAAAAAAILAATESDASFCRPIVVSKDSDLSIVRELLNEATNIVNGFVSITAENQINIPFSMRTSIESTLSDWTKLLNAQPSSGGGGGSGGEEVPLTEFSIDSSVYSMFNAAQREVYAFTSRDGYARWKATPSFAALIKKMRDGETVTARTRLDLDAQRLSAYRGSYKRQALAGEFKSVANLGASILGGAVSFS